MILNSVKKTGKVLIVHEDKVFSGFGAEVAALITEEAFEFLDGPVTRVGSSFTPVGFNRILEKAILPDTEKIYPYRHRSGHRAWTPGTGDSQRRIQKHSGIGR